MFVCNLLQTRTLGLDLPHSFLLCTTILTARTKLPSMSARRSKRVSDVKTYGESMNVEDEREIDDGVLRKTINMDPCLQRFDAFDATQMLLSRYNAL